MVGSFQDTPSDLDTLHSCWDINPAFNTDSTGSAEDDSITTLRGGKIVFDASLKTVEKKNGEAIVISRNAYLTIQDDDENLLEKYSIPYGAEILHTNNTKVEPGTLIAKWDPLTLPIISEQEGTIVFADLNDCSKSLIHSPL